MESRVSLPCSQEQATNISTDIKNNMSQNPRTEYSPGNVSFYKLYDLLIMYWTVQLLYIMMY